MTDGRHETIIVNYGHKPKLIHRTLLDETTGPDQVRLYRQIAEAVEEAERLHLGTNIREWRAIVQAVRLNRPLAVTKAEVEST